MTEYENRAQTTSCFFHGKENNMILAAAIAYKITETDKTVVLCGARHGDIFDQLKGLGFEPRTGY